MTALRGFPRNVVRHIVARNAKTLADTAPFYHGREQHTYRDLVEVHIQLAGPLVSEQSF